MNITENKSLFNGLISQSWKDESFKKSLINNPIQTIENFIGNPIYLEGGKQKIVVEDQGDNNIIYLNLPSRAEFSELELTDEQLEMVAGGSTPLCLYGGCFLVGLVIGIAAGSKGGGGTTNNTTIINNY
ncbi:class IIb bacteriocin, lactobin A/cerein 7B family [Lacihabitans lacunae]|uniref:Class IIb bacteriocin, lactobin A/cerein 7B family n=1 Tax=Lacihabitans lacunae TaxID=1028214 RepID=A0ABV7Z0E9_9BACT